MSGGISSPGSELVTAAAAAADAVLMMMKMMMMMMIMMIYSVLPQRIKTVAKSELLTYSF